MTEGTRPPGGAIRVGDFVVDQRSGELRGEAGRLVLSAQPLQVLLALAERPGGLVTRDELRARLWPANTYVDFDHGLNAVVKRLRDALGDSADEPRYIETIPRRGYRLIAAVAPADATEPVEGRAVASAAPSVAPPEPAPPRFPPPGARNEQPAVRPPEGAGHPVRSFALVALGAVVLAGAGVAYVSGPWREAEAAADSRGSVAFGRPTRLTFGPGLQTDAAWSPDGRRVAFTDDRHGQFDLFVQALDGGEPIGITSSPANETQPAWSPAGDHIVFTSDEGDGGLFTIRLKDRAIRRLATGSCFQPTWMPDGREIVFSTRELLALRAVDAEGERAPRELLKDAMASGAWFSFAVHPDGRIGLLGLHRTSRFGFYVSDREHRELRSATADGPPAMLLALRRAVWTRAGDAVFVEGRAAGLSSIWRVPVDPVTQAWRTPVQVPTGPAGADRVAISPDGRTVAFTSAQEVKRAWVFPFDADRGTPPGDGRAVTDEDASVAGLQLGADGKSIFYSEIRPGREPAPGVEMRLDTGQVTVLNADANSSPVPSPSGSGTAYQISRPSQKAPRDLEYALAWRSRDGRERLVARWGSGAVHPTDVRRDEQVVLGTWMPTPYTGPAALVEWPVGLAAASEPQNVLLAREDLQFWQGRYSPDGRWVSFVAVATGGGGGLQLGVVPAGIRGGSTWTRLAADHAWPDKPRWSPDGRTIYFVAKSASGYFALWGVGFDPDRGAQAGAPFLIRAFDSPRWHIDPELTPMEIGVAKGVLALPMRSVKGSIWLLSAAGT